MTQANNYIVYRHTTLSGKVYIGITKQKITKRWKNGLGYEGCTAFFRAIQKYGWDNINHEVVAEGLSKEDACLMEQALIAEHKSHDPEYGYNLTLGGEHYEPNEEWRRKARESHLRYYKEHPEARQRISETTKGRVTSEEQKALLSAKMKQYFIDHPEQREQRGRSFRGKKRGAEFSKALGERKSKSIICNETGKVYKSLKEASEFLGVHQTGITNVLHGRAKTCRGYTFSFYEGVVNE